MGVLQEGQSRAYLAEFIWIDLIIHQFNYLSSVLIDEGSALQGQDRTILTAWKAHS